VVAALSATDVRLAVLTANKRPSIEAPNLVASGVVEEEEVQVIVVPTGVKEYNSISGHRW